MAHPYIALITFHYVTYIHTHTTQLRTHLYKIILKDDLGIPPILRNHFVDKDFVVVATPPQVLAIARDASEGTVAWSTATAIPSLLCSLESKKSGAQGGTIFPAKTDGSSS